MMVGAAFERILVQPLENRACSPRHPHARLVLHPQWRSGHDLGHAQPHADPAPFPGALDDKFDIITDRVPNFFITYKALAIWVTVGLLVLLLSLLLQRTKLGLAYRAVAANAEIRPDRGHPGEAHADLG